MGYAPGYPHLVESDFSVTPPHARLSAIALGLALVLAIAVLPLVLAAVHPSLGFLDGIVTFGQLRTVAGVLLVAGFGCIAVLTAVALRSARRV